MEAPKPAGAGRDDVWSEAATAVLIEAWGERHLRCNRGNLRQNDWKEVSDAVNHREIAAGKIPKTEVQCKNRIDTLKKKYKVEKGKPSPSTSTWPFFSRLDFLIGPGKPSPSVSPPTPAVNFLSKNPNPNPNPNPKLRFSAVESSESSLDDEELMMGVIGRERGRKHRLENGGGSSEKDEERAALRELAKAVVKFGEIYERIESSKQHQIMELEKQRMEFTKELELQRMNMLIEAQVELQKLKRVKYASASTGKNS